MLPEGMEEGNLTVDPCGNPLPLATTFTRLGPADLYASLGPAITISLYCSLTLLTLTLWVHALYWRSRVVGGSTTTTLLQLLPVINITLTLPVLLAPTTGPLISLIQDGVAVMAMVLFTQFSTDLLGGTASISRRVEVEEAPCPLATPPLCCLIPCPRPLLTPRLFTLTLLPLRLLTVALTINILVNIFLVFAGFYPVTSTDQIFSLLNLHNLLIIPFFVSTMYSYKVLVSVLGPLLPSTSPRLRGILNFQMFVMCKASLGIIAMLEGRGYLPCLPGLPSTWGTFLLAGLVQVVVLSIPGLLLPRLYARDWNQVKARLAEDLKQQESGQESEHKDEALSGLIMKEV